MSRVMHKRIDCGSIDDGLCLAQTYKFGYFQSRGWRSSVSLVVGAVFMILLILAFGLLAVPSGGFLTSAIYEGLQLLTSNVSSVQSEERAFRCLAVDAGLSEHLDVEEKGILKDVRTSFIPPETIYIPPNCGDEIFMRDPPMDFDEQSRGGRQIRSSDGGDQEDTGDTGDTDETSPLPGADATSGFHSFWKGEGTPENIRVIQASIMKRYMDPSADPCNDFYQYACGNWAKLNQIPKDKAGYDTFEMLRESLDVVLRDLLTDAKDDEKFVSTATHAEAIKNKLDTIRLRRSLAQYPHKLSAVLRHYRRRRRSRGLKHQTATLLDAEQKAKDLFASCMNSERLMERGVQPLLDLLTSFGGWPVLDPNWNESKFDWLDLVAQLRLYNNDVFIVEWVGPDIKNSDENVIQIDQTSLGLPTRDYFLHESNGQYLNAYRTFMEEIIHLMGATKDEARRSSAEIVNFETELARITSSSEERANVSVLYKRMSIRELQTIVPEIDWNRYLSIVQERPVEESETVVIYALEFMQELVSLSSRSQPKTMANYLIWRFVRHRVNNLDDRFQDAKQKFFHVLFGREQSPPRWKNCVGQVNSNMGMALGAMFVQKYFDENSKKDTLQMTHELQESFRDILRNTDWLDDETKRLAEEKVNSMSLKIGYPDFILSQKELNKKYESLQIDRTKYFENTLNVLKHVARSEQRKLAEVVNKTIWQTAPAIVNAYYSRNKNQIMFPAGILQPPFYHRLFPRCLNYGGIGVVIGHELTHGFDDKGRLFDQNGNIHKWWSDSAISGFHERAQCLVFQYSNYTVSEVDIAVDGESTQGENIADNGGIRQAFRAYVNWAEENASKEMLRRENLPGLNMTNKQLFFLNFAQVWCGAMRPEATRSKLKTAVHSPGKFRVIGTLSNSEDFAREYGCPAGSPMNPVKKCSVW